MKQPREEFPVFAQKIRAEGYPELAAKLRTDRPGRVVGRASTGFTLKMQRRKKGCESKGQE